MTTTAPLSETDISDLEKMFADKNEQCELYILWFEEIVERCSNPATVSVKFRRQCNGEICMKNVCKPCWDLSEEGTQLAQCSICREVDCLIFISAT